MLSSSLQLDELDEKRRRLLRFLGVEIDADDELGCFFNFSASFVGSDFRLLLVDCNTMLIPDISLLDLVLELEVDGAVEMESVALPDATRKGGSCKKSDEEDDCEVQHISSVSGRIGVGDEVSTSNELKSVGTDWELQFINPSRRAASSSDDNIFNMSSFSALILLSSSSSDDNVITAKGGFFSIGNDPKHSSSSESDRLSPASAVSILELVPGAEVE